MISWPVVFFGALLCFALTTISTFMATMSTDSDRSSVIKSKVEARGYNYANFVKLLRKDLPNGVYLSPNVINQWMSRNTTNVIVHQYRSNSNDEWVRSATQVFLSMDHNVLLVDYSHMASFYYYWAAYWSPYVGYEVSRLLANLAKNNGLDPSTVDVVGYSLGAHVGGYIGQYFKALTGQTLKSITGLDPAERYFKGRGTNQLDATDAEFVQTIHTTYNPGNSDTVSTVDFLINVPSQSQPGCSPWFEYYTRCSHRRAVNLYLDGLGNVCPLFNATICDTGVPLQVGIGVNAAPDVQGKICISANGTSSPYCAI